MKCNYKGTHLYIEPETDFEANLIAEMFLNTKKRTVTVVSGGSISDVVGLRVSPSFIDPEDTTCS